MSEKYGLGTDSLKKTTSILVLAAALGAYAGTVQAQGADEEEIEEIITIGTRVKGRTVTSSPVPVDIITADSIKKNGQIETARLLRNLAPSFNYYESTISDGTDILRPATLRGLSPDQTLVLINGKRHVGFAWVGIGQTVNRGATGVDLNSIPAGGIKRIEILRDGAAAQYGSDAIAGVINFELRDDIGTEFRARWGSTYEGDGDQWSLSGNHGVEVGDGGFFNITFEAKDINRTNRAAISQRAGKVIMRIGDTAISDNYNFAGNFALPITENVEVYAFGTFATREGLSGGFFRWPFQADRSVLQVFPDGFLPLQTTRVQDFGGVFGLRVDLDDNWTIDASVNIGRNEFLFGAKNTINASIAAEFVQRNPGATDAQIAANSGPNEGSSGGAATKQLIYQVDVNGQMDLGWGNPLYVAFGGLWRHEKYTLFSGDLASFSCGSSATAKSIPSVSDPSVTANCGFQGFPGYSSAVAGSINRDNTALYLDIEANVTDSWLLTGAVRYEDYDGTADRVSGKVSTHIEVQNGFALRGALQTGFRAPSLPQIGFTSITTSAGADGLAQTLLAPNDSPFAKALGVGALKLETSESASFGFIFDGMENFTLTVDAYQINIDDRIALSGTLDAGNLPAGSDALAALLAEDIDQGQVFTNAIDTRTRGIDVVATYDMPLGAGDLTTTVALSFIDNKVKTVRDVGLVSAGTIFNRADEINLEDSAPSTRITATFDYQQEKLGALLRLNYYGSTKSGFFGFANPSFPAGFFVGVLGADPAQVRKIEAAVVVDLELSYDLTDYIEIAVGADNLLDQKPNKVPNNAISRLISDGVFPPNQTFGNFKFPWRGPAYGLNGGFYYLRASITF